MHITLPRKTATKLWHLALEQPGTVSGLLEKIDNDYEIRLLSAQPEWTTRWETKNIQLGTQFPFAYYQSFCTTGAEPTSLDWGNLPESSLLLAIMLDVKGLLVLNAFYRKAQTVSAVMVTLSSEPS